jgi:hypothetical protein
VHHDADIGGVELLINDRAIADPATDPQVPLDQWGQPGDGFLGVNPIASKFSHLDIVMIQSARAKSIRRPVVVVEMGQGQGMSDRIASRKASATKHQLNVVAECISRDTLP